MTLLPTETTKPVLTLNPILLFGVPKVGKSTFAAGLDDKTLFITTPGQDIPVEAYTVECRSWEEFLEIGRELKQGDHDFGRFCVDTVDDLQRMCAAYVLGGLNAGLKSPKEGYLHASDFEYGKGWNAVTEEFRLRMAGLCATGPGVTFISHTKEGVKQTRVGEIKTYAPDVGDKGSRQWLLGFVNHIFFAAVEDGQRVLRTQPAEHVEAGGRVPGEGALPDPLPLDPAALLEAAEAANAPKRNGSAKNTKTDKTTETEKQEELVA